MKTHNNIHLIISLPTNATHYNTPTHLLFAGLTDVGDVGEEVVVFRLGHGLAELCRVLEHADQDLQTVQIRVLRRDHLKNGLMEGKRKRQGGKRGNQESEEGETEKRGLLMSVFFSQHSVHVHYFHL